MSETTPKAPRKRYKAKKGKGRPHVGVRVEKADREVLKAIAAHRGITVSDLLRETIEQTVHSFIEQQE